jgi:hypothetical protein
MVYVSLTGATPRAVVRQARRVVRGATHVLGTKVRYPPGVVVYLSPSAPARLQTVLQTMGADGLAEEIARRLRDGAGRRPRLVVWIEPDTQMGRDFEIAVLERHERVGHRRAAGSMSDEQAADGLVGAVVGGWARLTERVPKGENELRWLEQQTGVAFRRLDAVRHARHSAAHETQVERNRLAAALRTIEEVERLLPPER